MKEIFRRQQPAEEEEEAEPETGSQTSGRNQLCNTSATAHPDNRETHCEAGRQTSLRD